MICLALQHGYVYGQHFAYIITTNVQNGVALHEHKPRNVFIHHRLIVNCMSAVHPSRLHSDTVTVVLSN